MTNPVVENNRRTSKMEAAVTPVDQQKCLTMLRPEEAGDLKKSNLEIECLLSSLSSILIGLSLQHDVKRWNPTAEKALGITAGEIMGHSLAESGVQWDWAKIEDGLSKCHQINAAVRVDDIGFTRTDGKPGYLGITINPIRLESDRLIGFIIIGADITDRKAMEDILAQTEKLKSIGQLAAGIAHEINTPTQYVGDNTRFLQDAFQDIMMVLSLYAQLLEAVKRKREKPVDVSWLGPPTKRDASTLPEPYQAEGIPVHPGRCAGEVAKFLEEEGRDWTLICDGGEASVWIGLAATAYRPGQIHATGANGTIGTGPGLAVGAWAANRKPVLWYTGDGSFGFYAMELDTMARLGVPVVCVISNDSAWGMIRLTEKFIRPEEVETKGHCNVELHHMRAYEKMVAMWDGYGERVTDPEEIVPAIKRAAANGKPSIVNVEVDKVNLSPFIAGYANMVKPSEE